MSFNLQWNCNGFFSRLNELKMLINEYDPLVICLQETHLKESQNVSLRNMNVYRNDEDIAAGDRERGVLIGVRNDIFSERVNVRTSLRLIAVRVRFPKNVTIVNVYFPPSIPLDEKEIESALSQINGPMIFVGDVNARNEIWGSDSTDNRGKLVEEVMNKFSLIPLNDSTPTHLSTLGTLSQINLTAVSPEISTNFNYQVLNDSHDSDHHPMTLNLLSRQIDVQNRPRWITRNFNWEAYTMKFQQLIDEDQRNVNSYQELKDRINEVASEEIPKSSGKPRRVLVPWWNKDLKEAIKKRRRAHKKYYQNKTEENLIELRKCRAKARLLQRQSQRESWSSFIDSMNCRTSISEIWNKIGRISGKKKQQRISNITLSDGTTTSDFNSIAEALATQFDKNSASTNYDQAFLKIKEKRERKKITHNQRSDLSYNAPFTIKELNEALNSTKDSAPGPDGILYCMLKYLPNCGKLALLKIYNDIWEGGEFPNDWHEALVIPILKPNKSADIPGNYRPISLTNCI